MKGAFVYNAKLKKFHFWDTHPSVSQTSHQKILDRLGYKTGDCIGGSIKENGELSFRSNTINLKNFHITDVDGTNISNEIRNFATSQYNPVYNMNYQIENLFKNCKLQFVMQYP